MPGLAFGFDSDGGEGLAVYSVRARPVFGVRGVGVPCVPLMAPFGVTGLE
jgi:hypothetical protein